MKHKLLLLAILIATFGGGARAQVSNPANCGQLSGHATTGSPSSSTFCRGDGAWAAAGGGGGGGGPLWAIVTQSGSYSILSTDFTSATLQGNCNVLTGSTAATFTLPATAPATNGQTTCVFNNSSAWITLSPGGNNINGAAGSLTIAPSTGFDVVSDGTNYWTKNKKKISPNDVGPAVYAAAGGTANAQTLTTPSCPSAYSAGMVFNFLPVAANTNTTPTLNVCSLGAVTITKLGTAALSLADLSTTAVAEVVCDASCTHMQLLDPQAGPPAAWQPVTVAVCQNIGPSQNGSYQGTLGATAICVPTGSNTVPTHGGAQFTTAGAVGTGNEMQFQLKAPDNYAPNHAIVIEYDWYNPTDTNTGHTVTWGAQYVSVTPPGLSAPTFNASANASATAINGTAGSTTIVQQTFSPAAGATAVAAGDDFYLRIFLSAKTATDAPVLIALRIKWL